MAMKRCVQEHYSGIDGTNIIRSRQLENKELDRQIVLSFRSQSDN